MITSPFPLLAPFIDQLSVSMLDKSDAVRSDADIARILETDRIASLRQVHGNKTVLVHDPTLREIEADGIVTGQANLTLTIRSADCQNFLVYAPEHCVVGLLHVGWRGLIADAIPTFLTELRQSYHIAPREVYVCAGPSLCRQCAEFTDPARELPNIAAAYVDGRHVDLQRAATDQFLNAGVRRERLDRHPDCTRCHSERWWTYRGGDREAVRTGCTNVLTCTMT